MINLNKVGDYKNEVILKRDYSDYIIRIYEHSYDSYSISVYKHINTNIYTLIYHTSIRVRIPEDLIDFLQSFDYKKI